MLTAFAFGLVVRAFEDLLLTAFAFEELIIFQFSILNFQFISRLHRRHSPS